MPLLLLAAPLLAITDAPPPAEPAAKVNLVWAALQLVPSPEIVVDGGTIRIGASWQITPLLYSFGINRKLSPWRSFVVEPIVRHAGSIELYVAPEVLGGSFPSYADRWIGRVGLRSYFPLIARGEALSLALGGSLLRTRGTTGMGLDVGLHTLGGLFGLRVGYSPTPGVRMTTIAFEIRVF
ncbi:MAG: hypothetical protein ABI134_33540 [Byssovorax sp.]